MQEEEEKARIRLEQAVPYAMNKAVKSSRYNFSSPGCLPKGKKSRKGPISLSLSNEGCACETLNLENLIFALWNLQTRDKIGRKKVRSFVTQIK